MSHPIDYTVLKMKNNSSPPVSETPRSDEPYRPTCDHVSVGNPSNSDSSNPAETDLADRIFREGNGRGLIKFCQELSGVLIRRYMVDSDVAVLRAKVCASLVTTLGCSKQQADCLVDLSLELIHARLHGKYRRSDIELSYLIATATGAVKDVAAN